MHSVFLMEQQHDCSIQQELLEGSLLEHSVEVLLVAVQLVVARVEFGVEVEVEVVQQVEAEVEVEVEQQPEAGVEVVAVAFVVAAAVAVEVVAFAAAGEAVAVEAIAVVEAFVAVEAVAVVEATVVAVESYQLSMQQ